MKRASGEPMRERKSRRPTAAVLPMQLFQPMSEELAMLTREFLPELQQFPPSQLFQHLHQPSQERELQPELQPEFQPSSSTSEQLPELQPSQERELQHQQQPHFEPPAFELPVSDAVDEVYNPFLPEQLRQWLPRPLIPDAVHYSPASPAASSPAPVAQPEQDAAAAFYSPASPAARSPPPAFEIPPNYHHLGDQLLVGANEFCEQVKVHIRKYDFRNGKLAPTRDGVTLTPHRWYLLSEAMDDFDASDPGASRLLERELFLSTITDLEGRVVAVNMQYAYETAAKTTQLSHSSMRVTVDQYRQLLEVRHGVSEGVKRMLYFALFKKFVLREVLFAEMSDRMPTADAERLLVASLVSCFKEAIEVIVRSLPIHCRGCIDFTDNQEGHTCQLSLRVQTNFEKALFKLSVRQLAETFVAATQTLHRYLTESFIDGLCLDRILGDCFDLFCRPDVDCLLPTNL